MLQHVSVRAPRNMYTMEDLRQTKDVYKSVCNKNTRKKSASGIFKCHIDLSFFLDLQFPLSECTLI
jgi:predicted metalloprotease